MRSIGVIGNIKDSFNRAKIVMDNIAISKAILERTIK